jgi:hypothetical protein
LVFGIDRGFPGEGKAHGQKNADRGYPLASARCRAPTKRSAVRLLVVVNLKLSGHRVSHKRNSADLPFLPTWAKENAGITKFPNTTYSAFASRILHFFGPSNETNRSLLETRDVPTVHVEVAWA